ncbi:MAG: UvrD-helicase domain-containing protein [Clostridia bacterium]|nr:UvrD-helicase domain-containing protein [Clostridia bacterium]
MSGNQLLELRKKIIEKDFSRMNNMQFKAVTTVKGPLLVLAGAGSGKTTVIVNRIINLIKYGDAYNSDRILTGFTDNAAEKLKQYLDGDTSVYSEILPMLSVDAPAPWQILTITFTNKAANELKERLVNSLGEAGNEIWASTFHSACVRILRRFGDRIGFSTHFTIYDTDDSKRLIKECQRQLNIDDKRLPHKSILNEISRAKDSLIEPSEYLKEAGADMRKLDIAKAYERYQQLLQNADAMDFDDIIVNTVKLLKTDREVLDYYRNRFRYIMVDEYQDTNHAQYVLVSLLAGGHNNLCVVGDDDQSIYSFRGATIENILSFENQFNNAVVIRLEENYRSTQTILDAANAVISHNSERKGKSLWTSNGMGEKITLKACADDISEGNFVANSIMDAASDKVPFSDNAVLYRMNAQSNIIERALVKSGIPYRIIGGHRFYDRKEIKDALAYLAVVSNPNDNIRLRRIVNEPKRGIGETTINSLFEISSRLGESVFSLMDTADEYSALSRSASKLKLFAKMINTFARLRESNTLAELFRIVMNESGYIAALDSDEKREERIENLDELYSTIARYEEENGENATLEGFLEEVALLSDIDNYNAELDTVTLMTLHSAKGLEFPYVYIVGMENGVFPSMQSIYEPSLMEEERRLAYVGITRAKKKLYITRALSRMQFGKTSMNLASEFIREIPIDLINDISEPRTQYSSSYSFLSKGSYGGYSDTKYQDTQKTVYKPGSGLFESTMSDSKNASAVGFKKGDSVYHKKFGKGLVLATQPLGNDILLEVAFESVGTKKLMEKMARLEKI